MLLPYLLARVTRLAAWAPVLLAQVQHAFTQPPVISQETTISWPVAVTLLAGAAIIIESRVKIARLESDLEKTQATTTATALQVAGQAMLLGEIKAGIAQVREDIRSQRGAA